MGLQENLIGGTGVVAHGPDGTSAEHDSAVLIVMLQELAALAARTLQLPRAEIRLTDGTTASHPPDPETDRIDTDRTDTDRTETKRNTPNRIDADPQAVRPGSHADRAPVAEVPLLTTDGETVGSLTAYGTAQTVPTTQQLDDVRTLARIGADRIVLQRRNALLASTLTDLAAARQAHHEAEQRWQTLIEHSPVAVAVLDGQARFRYVNPRLVALLDADDAASLHGRTCLDIVSEDRRAAATAGLLSVISGGAPILSRRSPMRTLSGVELTVEFSLAAIVDHGEPAVLVEVRDVTGAAATDDALRSSEERFHTVFSDSPAPMGIGDENGRLVDVNDALGALMGVEPAALIGARPVDFVHPDDRADFIVAGREYLLTGRPTRQELRFVRMDGEIRWLCLDRAPMAGPAGTRWVLGVAQDSTARKAAELALLHSRNDLAAVAAVAKCVQSGDDPRPLVAATIRSLSGADSVLMIEAAGDGSLQVTAADGGDLLGRSLSLDETSMTAEVWRSGERAFIPDITGDPRVHPGLMACGHVVGALWQPVTVQGRVEAVIVVGWRHRIDDLGDRAVRVVEVVADEAGASLRAARLHRELERSANTDPLTGSLNRRAWDRELHTLMDLAQLTGEPLAVAVVDLDHFKAFNDHFGHVAGDALLAEFADAAARCLRKQDVFARWGGEEFVVALPDCTQAEAADILDRVRLSVPAGLSCSIGHTTWIPGEALTSCIGRADSALYNAKKDGRNRVST